MLPTRVSALPVYLHWQYTLCQQPALLLINNASILPTGHPLFSSALDHKERALAHDDTKIYRSLNRPLDRILDRLWGQQTRRPMLDR